MKRKHRDELVYVCELIGADVEFADAIGLTGDPPLPPHTSDAAALFAAWYEARRAVWIAYFALPE